MTTNQIAYFKAKEDQRHNVAMERETGRHNIASEYLDKYRTESTYASSIYGTDKAYTSAIYGADSRYAASIYSADRSYASNIYAADSAYNRAVYQADKSYAASIYSSEVAKYNAALQARTSSVNIHAKAAEDRKTQQAKYDYEKQMQNLEHTNKLSQINAKGMWDASNASYKANKEYEAKAYAHDFVSADQVIKSIFNILDVF